jgi:hypothetical protein
MVRAGGRGDASIGSAVRAIGARVESVERLSERQVLEGMLLASGSNIATLLARSHAVSERGSWRR